MTHGSVAKVWVCRVNRREQLVRKGPQVSQSLSYCSGVPIWDSEASLDDAEADSLEEGTDSVDGESWENWCELLYLSGSCC